MKYLKPFLLLLCALSLLVSCNIEVGKEECWENPDYNSDGLDYLNPDPERQEIDIYWTYSSYSEDFQNPDYVTFDIKDRTIGFNGNAKDVVVQTIKPNRIEAKDEMYYFQIRMGLNYTNNNHEYQLEIKVGKDKKIFAKSNIISSTKIEGSRLTFVAVVDQDE